MIKFFAIFFVLMFSLANLAQAQTLPTKIKNYLDKIIAAGKYRRPRVIAATEKALCRAILTVIRNAITRQKFSMARKATLLLLWREKIITCLFFFTI